MKFLALVGLFFFSVFSIASAETIEKLNYYLYMTNAKIGDASLEYRTSLNDKNDKIISYKYATDNWIAFFDNVQETIETTIDEKGFPKRYTKLALKNGKTHKNREVIYDNVANKIYYHDKVKNKKRTYDIKKPYYDVLSALDYLRKKDLEIGQPFCIPFFNKKTMYQATVSFVRKDAFQGPNGKRDALVARIQLTVECSKASEGEIEIWFSDDKERIPLKLIGNSDVGGLEASYVGKLK
jgi:hypothetical protein